MFFIIRKDNNKVTVLLMSQQATSFECNKIRSIHSRKPSLNLSSLNQDSLKGVLLDKTPQREAIYRQEYQRLVKCLKRQIQNLSLTKHQRIRVDQWLLKLSSQTKNVVWLINRNFYLEVLYKMLLNRVLLEPFINLPPEGSLPRLTLYDVPFPIRQFLSKRSDSQSKRPSASHCSHSNVKIKSKKQSHLTTQYKIKPQNDSFLNFTTNFDKQNYSFNANVLQVNRKLFREEKMNTVRTQYTIKESQFNQRKGKTKQTKTQYINQNITQNQNQRGIKILIKVQKILKENQQKLGQQLSNKKLREKINSLKLKFYKDQKNINEQKIFFKTDYQMIEQKKDQQHKFAFDKACVLKTKEIKQKFTKTDQQTIEFFQYLQKFKLKMKKTNLLK